MAHKHSFPLQKIEAVIQLAQKYNLVSLEIDGIKIIPTPRLPAPKPKMPPMLKGIDGNLRRLTPREFQEYGLFGQAAILGDLDDSLTDYSNPKDNEL